MSSQPPVESTESQQDTGTASVATTTVAEDANAQVQQRITDITAEIARIKNLINEKKENADSVQVSMPELNYQLAQAQVDLAIAEGKTAVEIAQAKVEIATAFLAMRRFKKNVSGEQTSADITGDPMTQLAIKRAELLLKAEQDLLAAEQAAAQPDETPTAVKTTQAKADAHGIKKGAQALVLERLEIGEQQFSAAIKKNQQLLQAETEKEESDENKINELKDKIDTYEIGLADIPARRTALDKILSANSLDRLRKVEDLYQYRTLSAEAIEAIGIMQDFLAAQEALAAAKKDEEYAPLTSAPRTPSASTNGAIKPGLKYLLAELATLKLDESSDNESTATSNNGATKSNGKAKAEPTVSIDGKNETEVNGYIERLGGLLIEDAVANAATYLEQLKSEADAARAEHTKAGSERNEDMEKRVAEAKQARDTAEKALYGDDTDTNAPAGLEKQRNDARAEVKRLNMKLELAQDALKEAEKEEKRKSAKKQPANGQATPTSTTSDDSTAIDPLENKKKAVKDAETALSDAKNTASNLEKQLKEAKATLATRDKGLVQAEKNAKREVDASIRDLDARASTLEDFHKTAVRYTKRKSLPELKSGDKDYFRKPADKRSTQHFTFAVTFLHAEMETMRRKLFEIGFSRNTMAMEIAESALANHSQLATAVSAHRFGISKDKTDTHQTMLAAIKQGYKEGTAELVLTTIYGRRNPETGEFEGNGYLDQGTNQADLTGSIFNALVTQGKANADVSGVESKEGETADPMTQVKNDFADAITAKIGTEENLQQDAFRAVIDNAFSELLARVETVKDALDAHLESSSDADNDDAPSHRVALRSEITTKLLADADPADLLTTFREGFDSTELDAGLVEAQTKAIFDDAVASVQVEIADIEGKITKYLDIKTGSDAPSMMDQIKQNISQSLTTSSSDSAEEENIQAKTPFAILLEQFNNANPGLNQVIVEPKLRAQFAVIEDEVKAELAAEKEEQKQHKQEEAAKTDATSTAEPTDATSIAHSSAETDNVTQQPPAQPQQDDEAERRQQEAATADATSTTETDAANTGATSTANGETQQQPAEDDEAKRLEAEKAEKAEADRLAAEQAEQDAETEEERLAAEKAEQDAKTEVAATKLQARMRSLLARRRTQAETGEQNDTAADAVEDATDAVPTHKDATAEPRTRSRSRSNSAADTSMFGERSKSGSRGPTPPPRNSTKADADGENSRSRSLSR